MTAELFRHALRAVAESCGITAALGGPAPEGRRFTVTVHHHRVVTDSDTSARFRGQVLVAQEPASLSPSQRARLHAAALSLAGALGLPSLRFEFAGTEPPILMSAETVAAPHGMPQGVSFTATITAGEPAARASTAPISGLLTRLEVPPEGITGLHVGEAVSVTPGTVLMSIQARASDETAARAALRAALASVRLDGVASNLRLLRQCTAADAFTAGLASCRDLEAISYDPIAIEVIQPGLQTSVQDWQGRLGYWQVGVPPSGAMDDLALRLANQLVGNDAQTAALEITLSGPILRFHTSAIICLAGAPFQATLNGQPCPWWRAVQVPAGAVVSIGSALKHGLRAVLAVRHGIDVPPYLGSRATFELGGFGGFQGRTLRAGDWLPLIRPSLPTELDACPPPMPVADRPVYEAAWQIGVLEGPHAAPEFFTPIDMAVLYASSWEVHHNSNRTGVRLIGPKPTWARRDGGEAGLHPSNIHDNAYAVGAIDFTGDMPILLGPDGPSLGGFVCPAVVVSAERWKLGQLRPGSTVRFVRLSSQEAKRRQDSIDRTLGDAGPLSAPARQEPVGDSGAILHQNAEGPLRLTVRRSGDRYLLLEYGEALLDLALRLRVHQLMMELERLRPDGIIDLTPGIRSLQIHHDPGRLPQAQLLQLVVCLDAALPSIDQVAINARTVHMPLSWDDPATQLATERYMRTVRNDAPWCPSNLEFIRRINGLESIDQVRAIVFGAEYLVLGLGDVYLGAPVATPLDPRHRLITTKYNPARTWTPQNAVGIGGAYLCVYGMEGPGGYQFVGRTVQVWKTWGEWQHAAPAGGSKPWLLRFFDRIRFYPVSSAELLRLRDDPSGEASGIRVEPSLFEWRSYERFLIDQAGSIQAFRARQRAAFDAERARWEAQALAGGG